MNIVYCLTTRGIDVHSLSTLISVLSVRRLHPKAAIFVLTDTESAQALRDAGHPLLQACDEIRAIATPPGSPAMRNRFVKTQQRRLISGDFLYLDADCIAVAPLDEIFQVSESFAGVPNHNSPRPIDGTFADEIAIFQKHGWAIPNSAYINGGVLFLRDRPETYELSELWHRKWQEASAGGKHFDQPSLNSALHDSGIAVGILPHRFNAQVQLRPWTAVGASIWHIYASLPAELSPKTELDRLLAKRLGQGTVTLDEVEALCGKNHPWVTSNVLDAWVVRSMLKRDFLPIDAFERTWLAGRKTRACLKRVKSLFKK